MPQTVRGCVATFMFVCVLPFAGEALAQSASRGKLIFNEKAEPACAICHTLKDAGASGEVGPNLDELKPDLPKIRQAVKNGVGNMPPFGDSLSNADIEAVSRYVAGAVATGAKK
jgi:mono/diheme cytochrome c family protein